ncbi:MAG: Epoxide hydrolase [Polyangiaceae bacterium]|jgi:pimeloyl-ACP methyl ester carboxylesterase|nr:Epoxide hydrolase [Polyangiaceae bacterium]
MIDSQMVSTPGGRLHVRVIGSGPPVLLLHGFPDSSLGFRDLCESLAARGFRAIAPDLLGYGMSEKPAGLAPYRTEAAVADLAALARWAGGQVAVLGHDWGGTLSYCLAAEHPELVSKLVVINAAHPESYARALRTSFQLLRSWYILFFQLRKIAEWVVTRRLVFRWLLRRLVVHKERLTDARVEASRRELLRPGAATAALGYYRAAFRWPIRCQKPIQAPTLILWGDADPALDQRLLADVDRHVPNVRVRHVEGAGHFVQWDEPERVVDEVAHFLR